MMTERERVIKGLECCSTYDEFDMPCCEACPYSTDDDTCFSVEALHKDTLRLLKAQEPRVLTLAEVRLTEYGVPVWLEICEYKMRCAFVGKSTIDGLMQLYTTDEAIGYLSLERYYPHEYNHVGMWRCWSVKPTDEQRRAVEWQG